MRKNPFKKIFEISEPKTNDILGAYPEKVHVKAMPERRYLKTTRILTIFSIISLSVSIFFASVIYMMTPNVKTQVQLIERNKRFPGLKYIDKAETVQNPFELYFEKFVEEYVVMRHEVKADIDSLINMWDNKNSKLYMRSSNEVSSKIKNEFEITKDRLINKGFTRKVNVLWAQNISFSENGAIFFVKFETLDFYHGVPSKQIRVWESFIRLRRGPIMLKPKPNAKEEEEKRFLLEVTNNPLNVKVVNYVLSFVSSRPLLANR